MYRSDDSAISASWASAAPAEAYSAAYFMDRDVFENNSIIPEVFCAKVTNMETATMSLMPSKRRSGWKNEGTVKKTVDLFGFAITHLSFDRGAVPREGRRADGSRRGLVVL